MGMQDEPLWDITIPRLLNDTVKKHGDRQAAVFFEQGVRWTYSEFAREVEALASGLLELGLEKGERIGIWAPSRFEWLLTQFATARLGLVLVNINPAYRPFELEYALNKVGCRAIVTARKFKTSDYTDMLQKLGREKLPLLEIIICMGKDIPGGMLSFDEVLENGRSCDRGKLDAVSNALQPDDAINIQFTSGTTGLPKGACLTHRNIVNNARFVTAAMEFTEADRLCIPVPFYHCFGMVMGTLGCVTKGAAMIVPSEGFDPEMTMRSVSEEKATAIYGVPTMFVAELEVPGLENMDLSNLRTGIMSGAPCPIELMRKVQAVMNMKDITIAYGMTETSPVSFQCNIDDPIEKRVTSVGRVLPHVEVKLVDEKGNTVRVGEKGEVLTRGYSVMKGYWGEEEKTASSIDADGWMHTGDLATFDADGYLKITGRVKDMICRGGENIYPREIEDFLYTNPAISQAQVFGVPDEKYGEIVCAWIVLAKDARLDEEDIKAFCRENIAHFKVPAHVRFKDELPMTVTGKPQKFVMSEAMREELGVGKIETA